MELSNIHASLVRDLGAAHNATPIEAARYRGLDRALIWSGSGRALGWSVRAAGGDMILKLRAGHDASGELMSDVYVPMNASSTVSLPFGISFPDGLFADMYQVTGTGVAGTGLLTGAVYIGGND
jgi:hypothetical protein